jgi:tRNA modification GTPase
VADAEEALARAAALVGARAPALELLAFELGVAQGRLGEITGRHTLGATGAEVLDAIFSRFCIGK